MSNPTLESIIHEILDLKRMREELDAAIATIDCREGKADPMSEAFLQMAGVFSQLELAMIRAQMKSGMNGSKPSPPVFSIKRVLAVSVYPKADLLQG